MGKVLDLSEYTKTKESIIITDKHNEVIAMITQSITMTDKDGKATASITQNEEECILKSDYRMFIDNDPHFKESDDGVYYVVPEKQGE